MEIDEGYGTDESRRKRIESLRSALNYYKSKNLSLEATVASMQQSRQIPEDMKTFSEVSKNTRELHDGTMLLLCLQDCVNLFRNTLSCIQLTENRDFGPLQGEILNKIEGIVYFSKSIMKLYEEKLSELDIIEKKKMYVDALSEFEKHLESMKAKERAGDDEESELMQKADLIVNKINLIRTMKAVLIGFTSVNYPNILHQFENLQNPTKRNLTIDDFIETWDFGLNT